MNVPITSVGSEGNIIKAHDPCSPQVSPPQSVCLQLERRSCRTHASLPLINQRDRRLMSRHLHTLPDAAMPVLDARRCSRFGRLERSTMFGRCKGEAWRRSCSGCLFGQRHEAAISRPRTPRYAGRPRSLVGGRPPARVLDTIKMVKQTAKVEHETEKTKGRLGVPPANEKSPQHDTIRVFNQWTRSARKRRPGSGEGSNPHRSASFFPLLHRLWVPIPFSRAVDGQAGDLVLMGTAQYCLPGQNEHNAAAKLSGTNGCRALSSRRVGYAARCHEAMRAL